MPFPRLAYATALCFFQAFFTTTFAADRADITYADFEQPTYGDWTVTGDAFGSGPAQGTLPHQMDVGGFKGKRLVNSYHGGDDSTGTLTSPEFKIERKYVAFLVGGGAFAGKTCCNLVVDGKVVRTAIGQNTNPGGREFLEDARWDVTEFADKSAHIQIVDGAKGGWGHILVDHIVFTDNPELSLQPHFAREIAVTGKVFALGVKNGAAGRQVRLMVDGQTVREFGIEAANDAPDWWANVDVSAWQGKTMKIAVDSLPDGSTFLAGIEQSDAAKGREGLYSEALRPQFHFSPARGWTNDPNGLVYYNGEYHLFFQHNPYGTQWGNMHWGHAVSKDLVHWQEVATALYPDSFGTMFSGSAVVDWKNTSGLGAADKPPLVLTYTADAKSVQCIASSTDGRTFTKYANNPVVPMISGGNRDPKVFWYEPGKHWVMVLYVVAPPAGEPNAPARNTIHILTSPNLKDWTIASQIEGFFECPDLFPLAVDGDPKNTKWVLTAASSEYMIGAFNGKVFTPETPKLKGHLGRGFYAAQTFSDIPAADGRRIMIGWFQTPSPKMPFNQSMTVPLELKLLTTPEGPRLTYMPVKELELLRDGHRQFEPGVLKPDAAAMTDAGSELLDVRMEVAPSDESILQVTVHGAAIRYDTKRQELAVNGHKASAPLRDGKLRLVILADRNSLEIFASDGLCYIPFPFIPAEGERGIAVSASGGDVKLISADIHVLKSSWPPR